MYDTLEGERNESQTRKKYLTKTRVEMNWVGRSGERESDRRMVRVWKCLGKKKRKDERNAASEAAHEEIKKQDTAVCPSENLI